MTDEREETVRNVRFHHTKSNLFRVVHADGLIGNLTPKGDVFVCFYHERMPIPDSVVFNVTEDGSLGTEIRDQRITTTKGVIREMEVGIVLDLEDAKSLLSWLNVLIERVEKGTSAEEESEGTQNG